MTLIRLLEVVTLVTDVVMPAAAFCLYFFRRARIAGWQKSSLFIYLVFILIILLITDILANLRIHNLVMYHIYTFTEFTLISKYIITQTGSDRLKRLHPWVAVVFGIICTLNAFFVEPFSKDFFNSNTATLSGSLLLILAMYYIYQLSKTDIILEFHKLPSFWIVTAFLVSSAISIPLILKYSYYTSDPANYASGDTLWFIIDLSNILKFALICVGLLCYKKPPGSHSYSV